MVNLNLFYIHKLPNNEEVFNFIKEFEITKTVFFCKHKSSIGKVSGAQIANSFGEFRVEFNSSKFLKNEISLSVGKQFKKVKFVYENKTENWK